LEGRKGSLVEESQIFALVTLTERERECGADKMIKQGECRSYTLTDTHRHSQTLTDTHRHTQTHTDTHRHTQTLTDTHRHTQTLTDTHRYTQTHTDTHRHSQTNTDKHRHTQTQRRQGKEINADSGQALQLKKINGKTKTQKGKIEREKQTDRQTDRQIERQRDRERFSYSMGWARLCAVLSLRHFSMSCWRQMLTTCSTWLGRWLHAKKPASCTRPDEMSSCRQNVTKILVLKKEIYKI